MGLHSRWSGGNLIYYDGATDIIAIRTDTDGLLFYDSAKLAFGDADDVTIEWDGTNLEMLPATDDTGAFNIGDGTTDFDFKIFLGSTTAHALFDRGNADFALTGVTLTPKEKVSFSDEVVHSAAATQTKSANYTMTAADSGYITYIDTDAFTITLPATVAGLTYTFVNAGADGAVLITVSPDAADQIQGVGLTAADDKDLLNTKATAKKGDLITLVGDGVLGWVVTQMHGTWARQA